MNVLIVGSKSIHVSSYVKSIGNEGVTVQLLSEEICNFEGVTKEFHVNFRRLNPISILKNYFALKSLLKALKPDIIHIHQVNRLAYFVTKAATILAIPVITTAWGSDVLLVPKQNKLFRFLVIKSLKRSKIVTGDSQEMIDEMKLLAPSNTKYHLVQYGIDPISSKSKKNVVYSNRLHKSLYHIHDVIDYFKVFATLNPTWELVIAGSGDETEKLVLQVEKLNLQSKVKFLGWLDSYENRSNYADAQIYVSIPESDGTSVSVLEAMSAGCIPVLSNLPSNVAWVKDGENGIIVANDEVDPFGRALLLNKEKLVAHNEALILEKATRNASNSIFNSYYNQLIN
jgi:glycosyltransferase involved in cell wall biosynthesis